MKSEAVVQCIPCVFDFGTGICSVVQTDLESGTFFPQPPMCCTFRSTLLGPSSQLPLFLVPSGFYIYLFIIIYVFGHMCGSQDNLQNLGTSFMMVSGIKSKSLDLVARVIT